jgi:HAMP domain-containing protein
MTLRNVRNFIFGVGIVVLLIAVSNIISASRLSDAVNVVVELTTLQEVVNGLDQIDKALEEERIAVGQYPLNGDEQMITRISEAQAQYDESWAVIMKNRGDEKAEVLANISTARETYKGMLNEVITEYQSNPANNDAASKMSTAITFYLQNLDPALSSFREPEIQAFLDKSKAEAAEAQRYIQQSRIVSIIGTASTLVGVGMTFVYAFGMTRIVRSILEIINTANSISRGDLDIPIDVDKPGEIGELAQAIERMRTSLKAAIERLRR